MNVRTSFGRGLLAGLLSLLGAAMPWPAPLALAQEAGGGAEASQVDALADAYLAAYFERNPAEATYLGVEGAQDDRLGDNTLEGLARWEAFEDSLLAEMESIDPDALRGTPAWALNGRLLETLQASRQVRVCRQSLWPADPLGGWQVWFAMLATRQPVGSEAARAAALRRWRGLPAYLDSEVANMRRGLALGFSTPRRPVEMVIGQLDAILDATVEESPFYDPAARDSTAAFVAAWQRLLADEISPAIARYRDFLRDEYAPSARESFTIAAHPDGAACYAALYRQRTSLKRTPDDIFRLGQEITDAYEARLIRVGEEIFGTSDPDEIRARVASDSANRFTSREEVLAAAKRSVERARQAAPEWFNHLPETPMVVEPVPAYREAAVSASYDRAPEDGSGPATYNIPLYRPEEQRRGSNEVQAFHEGFPGHHLQIALAQEQGEGHPLLKYMGNSAFSEGWARYAESLAAEMGLYESPYARLSWLIWPAHGMLADAGIHSQGWSVEQAAALVTESGGLPPQMGNSLVVRSAVWPAQLTAYDSGAHEIFALREEAEQALGENFDIRDFHDVVLEDGAIPLSMLREKVERWIEMKRHSARFGPDDVATPRALTLALHRWASTTSDETLDIDDLWYLMDRDSEAILLEDLDEEGRPDRRLLRGWLGNVDRIDPAGWLESVVDMKVLRQGRSANVWAEYEARNVADGPVIGRGITNLQMYRDGERWWGLGWVDVPIEDD